MFSSPTVAVTYKGKTLTQRYFDEHPEIHNLYPSRADFLSKFYIHLVNKGKETHTEQFLEIAENSVKINGILQ